MADFVVNVETIMKTIREQIAQNDKVEVPLFSSVPLQQQNEMSENIQQEKPIDIGIDPTSPNRQQMINDIQFLHGNADNPYYWEFGKGKKAFIRRVIRRLVKCVGLPICNRQTVFNHHVAETADAIRANMDEIQQKLIEHVIWNSDRMNEIRDLQIQNKQKNELIQSLFDKVQAIQKYSIEGYEMLMNVNESQKQVIDTLQHQVDVLIEHNQNQMQDISFLQKQVEELVIWNQDRINDIGLLQAEKATEQGRIEELTEWNKDRMKEVSLLQNRIAELTEWNQDRMREVSLLQNRVEEHAQWNQERMKEICMLQEERTTEQQHVYEIEKQLVKAMLNIK